MLKKVKIENFRCFPTFELQSLGQLNLFVGENNSGKTSILEAVQLLTSQSHLQPLTEVMLSRGEYISNQTAVESELEMRHLFYGHNLTLGSKFSIAGETEDHRQRLTISIEQIEQLNLFGQPEELALVLVIERLDQETESIKLPLSIRGGLTIDDLGQIRRDINKQGVKTEFLTSSSLKTHKMMELFDRVVLTPEENIVIEALQTIEPSIERIATVATELDRSNSSRRGFMVKLTGKDQPVPIGSMGDGIWRMLGLILAMVNAKNGILLVDEIDTGLHFSTMSDMWKLVWNTAKRLQVQVFATTHSNDCWHSLAEIASADHPSAEGITIHRIEKDKSCSIVFTERQIVIACERGIEVR